MSDSEQRWEAHKNIRDEQFWFTATTLAVNGFAISTKSPFSCWATVPIATTLLSAYCIFLVVHRNGVLARKIAYPEHKEPKDQTCEDKLKESWYNIKASLFHFPWIVCEFSGSLFYVLLIFASFIGVWASATKTG